MEEEDNVRKNMGYTLEGKPGTEWKTKSKEVGRRKKGRERQ